MLRYLHRNVGNLSNKANAKVIAVPDVYNKIKKLQQDTRTVKHKLMVEPLVGRELIQVRGEEAGDFLQGLITNDIRNIQTGTIKPKSMYALFLNKGGRVLYDTIIYGTPEKNTYLVECDATISNELRRHLRIYRVRRKIDIEPAHKLYQPWVVFNPSSVEEGGTGVRVQRNISDLYITEDPRTSHLGMRILAGPGHNFEYLASIFEDGGTVAVQPPSGKDNYKTHRYRVGVGEGVDDLPPGKANPLESNCDFLNGVSFNKGCYIGQELTARVHHTGIVRKRLMPMRLTTPLNAKAQNVVHSAAGANLGKIMGTSGERALALLRVEKVLAAPRIDLVVDEDEVFVERPSWWPKELPNKLKLNELEGLAAV